MNVEAYRATGEGQRFLDAAITGADFLLETMRDPELGGYYWSVSPTGAVVDDMKQGYANVHLILAQAHLYDVTGNETYLTAALDQLAVLEKQAVVIYW